MSAASTRIGSLGIIAALAILHQDFWLWDNAQLVFGFMPAGLAYHAGFSIVATGAWAVVVWLGWPPDTLDDVEPHS